MTNTFLLIVKFLLLYFIPGYLLLGFFKKGAGKKGFVFCIFFSIVISLLFQGLVVIFLLELASFYYHWLILANFLWGFILLGLTFFNQSRVDFWWPFKNFKKFDLYLIFLILLSFCLFCPPSEWIVGGKDPGSYVNIGVHFYHDHEYFVYDENIKDLGKEGSKYFYRWGLFPSMYTTDLKEGELTPQFFHLFPAIIASWYGAHQNIGLTLSLMPIFAVLAWLAVFYFTKEALGKNSAFLTVIFLIFNFAFFWYSKFPNSEYISIILIYSGLMILSSNLIERKKWLVLAGVFLGGAFFARIDSALYLIPTLLLTPFFLKRKVFFNYFLVSLLLVFSWAWLDASVFSRPYASSTVLNAIPGMDFFTSRLRIDFDFLMKFILLAPWVIWGGIIIMLEKLRFSFTKFLKFLKIFIIIVWIGIMIILYLQGMFVRLSWGKNSLNMFKLAQYLSHPVVVFGWLGLGVLFINKKPLGLAIFLGVVFIYYPFRLYKIQIHYPTQPWWARRLLVEVFPGLLIGFVYFLKLQLKKIFKNKRIYSFVMCAVALLVLSYELSYSRSLLGFKEHQGAIKVVEALAQKTENADIVFMEGWKWGDIDMKLGMPLYFIHQKPVIRLKREEDSQKDKVAINRQWKEIKIRANEGETVYFVSRRPFLADFDYQVQRIDQISWQYQGWGSRFKLVKTPVTGKNEFYIYKVVSQDAEVLRLTNELEIDKNFFDGFYKYESGFRWSKEKFSFEFFAPDSILESQNISSLEFVLDLEDKKLPYQKPLVLKVDFNDKPIKNYYFEDNKLFFDIPVSNLKNKLNQKVEVNGPTFQPVHLGKKDSRTLGLPVKSASLIIN